jgi:hypothetical protein
MIDAARSRLIEQLEALIAWRACCGPRHVDISLCAPVEPQQYEVASILEDLPGAGR